MLTYKIKVSEKEGIFDAVGHGALKDIQDLGIQGVRQVHFALLYYINGDVNQAQITRIAEELLIDKITQEYAISEGRGTRDERRVVEIAYNQGVMDPVEESVLKAISDMGINGVISVRTAKQYYLEGEFSEDTAKIISEKLLYNKVIQHVANRGTKDEGRGAKDEADYKFKLITVDLLSASDKKLREISKQGQLFLNLSDMRQIKNYFKSLGRNPTDCELETIAQTWSEHCRHKTFRGKIEYREVTTSQGHKVTSSKKIINNLLKSTIMKVTKELNKHWCVSVFKDNAGIIKFNDNYNICFKVETHNHPSALEPFGGANTGIGGVIRDILGTGLGAKPICCTDVFCFAPPDTDFKDLPPGTLHPKRVMKGVVSGVRDYGNKMGIPTVNGAILFDKKYVGNPLVYCGNVGIMPKDKVFKKVLKGDLVIVAGGKTGRDGIHGATFSSGELTTESEVVSSGAVQIGDPIQEKKLLDALIKARDKNLYTAVTDCGAGGLSSAVGEMGEVLGVKVDLEKVPLKYDGLNYEEIWISESQERMVFSVRPKNVKKILEVFSGENVEATVIGEFTGSKKLELFFKGDQVCDIDMEFLYEGTPKITKEAVWEEPSIKIPVIPLQSSLNDKLLEILSHYNVCSKEWVIRQYDHEVQGGSVIKPLVGVNCDGPSDASVITPKLGSLKGIAISNGINSQYGKIDPFWMAASCIDEAVRQIVSVGGDVERIAILDNFCWGNPDKPDRLGSLVRAAEGCYKTAVGFQVPFISGKDSLYNEYAQGNESIAIPGTILISAIGIVDDVTKTVTMDFKERGNLIYCIGETHDEMGGSIYLDTFDCLGSTVPKVNTKKAMKSFKALNQAVSKGLVKSIHDCSEGGLGVALAEMAFSGMLGATIHLDKVPYKGDDVRSDKVLFSESNSRFVVEVTKADQIDFEKILEGITFGVIGQVEETPEFIVYGRKDEVCVNLYIQDLKEAWQKPLRW